MKKSKFPKYSVFIDFDNTITPFDVLDDIVKCFSINKNWVALEKKWKNGKIGSQECLEGQLNLVRISKNALLKYLAKIKIDPCFYELLDVLKKNRINPVILSDNFSFIINHILKNNNIRGIKLYANKIRFSKERLIASFPHKNIACFRCAHCKTNNLLKNKSRDKIIYIGDGLSDICPSKYADIIFAKGTLLKNLKNTKKRCIAIKNLGNVSRYLRREFNGTKK